MFTPRQLSRVCLCCLGETSGLATSSSQLGWVASSGGKNQSLRSLCANSLLATMSLVDMELYAKSPLRRSRPNATHRRAAAWFLSPDANAGSPVGFPRSRCTHLVWLATRSFKLPVALLYLRQLRGVPTGATSTDNSLVYAQWGLGDLRPLGFSPRLPSVWYKENHQDTL